MARDEALLQLEMCDISPYVLSAKAVGEFQNILFIVMDKVIPNNFLDFIQSSHMSPMNKQYYRKCIKHLTEAAKGLEAMHEKGFVHGDVKPQNILYNDDQTLIIDFGFTEKLPPGKECIFLHGAHGTPGYVAPEMMMRHHQLSKKTDVFALGSSMLFAFSPSSLWPLPNGVPDVAGIDWEYLNLEIGTSLTSLIKDCLEVDPINRPNMSQISTCLEKISSCEDDFSFLELEC